MLKPHITRSLVVIAVTGVVAAILAMTATAAPAAKRFKFDAGVASCYVPNNVYGGSGPTITAPSVRFTNQRRSLQKVTAWARVVDLSTGNWISYARIGFRSIAPGYSATFPAKTVPLQERSTSNFFPAGVYVQLDVRSHGRLIQIWTGIPSAYDTYTNGAFFPTYTGRNAWC